MTKRIFQSICLVAMAVFLSSITLIMGVLYGYFSRVQQNSLKIQTDFVSHGVNREGLSYFQGLNAGSCRITLMSPDGTILYDSHSDKTVMKNHLEREEIRQALSDGYGESSRYSSTLMERSFYCASRLDDGSILRLSVTHSTVLTLLLGMSQPVFLVFSIAVVLSIILAARLSGRIVKPLNALDLDRPMAIESYEELAPLLRRIGSQQQQLRIQKEELHRRQEELRAVISNMKEGILLLNPDGEILSINPAAMELLDSRGIRHNPQLQDLLEQALQGEAAQQTLELKNRHYQITASPVISGQTVSGAALLLFDVTEKENAEQMRREFTANVSHELKTPLHAISGYAELIANHMARPEDICPFAGRIYAEAQRMAKLIEDILNLSHLDENAGNMQFEQTDLYETARMAVKSLMQEAEAAGVTMTLSGESAVLHAIPQLLSGIVRNLCDNAIKYNRPGGTVLVRITNTPDTAVLCVRDTGIGIPPEHQEHIFERFYRVDKSHSKEVGGTGLGLSIVKHSAKIHQAGMHLDSIPGKGTQITLRFPKHPDCP